MNWILAVSLLSNPDGLYTREFKTEAQCVTEMNSFIHRNQGNPLVAGVACLNRDDFEVGTDE